LWDALRVAPGQKAGKRSATVTAVTRKRSITVTTYRIYADQRAALQRAALERREASGATGRADASEVLRDILDEVGMRGAK
jgi:hypothetical protein